MAYYTVTVGGTDICKAFGVTLSKFEQEPPPPKIITVDIPAGVDLDITNAIGATAFHNGLHRFVFAVVGADVVEKASYLKSFVHGYYKPYVLSWDGYSYSGRWEVTRIERLSSNAALVTIEVSHYPIKTRRDVVDILANPAGSHTVKGSQSYENVTIQLEQSGFVTFNRQTAHYEAGTHLLANAIENDFSVNVMYDDWLYRIEKTNLIVNRSHYVRRFTDVDFDDRYFAVSGTNLKCTGEYLQHATLKFTRKGV